MINSELSEISYVIQAGVTTYPIGFEYHFNENNSPQLLVKIGESVAIINVDFQLSADESEIILIPTEEEAKAQTSPNDTRWMDRIVGKELLITRDIPFVQSSDYTVGRISPEQIEYDFDRTVMRDQEILHKLSDFTVDVALAESLANAAVETANEAATAANQATATANTALETANNAIVTANDAKAVATQASQDAVDAMAEAASAVNKANEADLTATSALENSAQAVTVAQGAEAAVANKQDKLTAGTNVSIDGTTINVDGYSKAQVDNKVKIIEADVDANADAIQKTRADFISADSDIHTILNNHASELTTLHNDVDAVGDQVSGIEEKIPGTASASNPLVTKQQLLDEEMDIREDLNSGLSELQTQVTAQAAEIVKKQDKLTAGENITIVDGVISSTGGGDATFPDQTGNSGKFLKTDGSSVSWANTLPYSETSDSIVAGFTTTKTMNNTVAFGKNIDVPTGTLANVYFGKYIYGGLQRNTVFGSASLGTNTNDTIVLGQLSPSYYIGESNSFFVAKTEGYYKLLDMLTGTIPAERLSATEGTAGQVLTKTDDGMEWKDAQGGGASGDFLPLAGGTMTGSINYDTDFGDTKGSIIILSAAATTSGILGQQTKYGSLQFTSNGYFVIEDSLDPIDTSLDQYLLYRRQTIEPAGDGTAWLGSRNRGFLRVVTKSISNGGPSSWDTYDIAVPEKSGTMATIEDIAAIGGDGTTGQVLTKTDDGFAWQDSTGGGSAEYPDQTDNAGKFLQTDGATVKWADALINNSTDLGVLSVGYGATATGATATAFGANSQATGESSVAVGPNASATETRATAIGTLAQATQLLSNALGAQSEALAYNATQIGSGTNETNGSLQFRSYQLVSDDGTIPTDRYTTTPTGAGTYVPKLTIAEDGTATREWGAESTGGGGAGGDYLPLSGGTLTGKITRDIGTRTGTSSRYDKIFDFSGSVDAWGDGNLTYSKLVADYSLKWSGAEEIRFLHGENSSYGISMYFSNDVFSISPVINTESAIGMNKTLGKKGQWWDAIYTEYIHAPISSGSSDDYTITVPRKKGTMVVATPPTDNGTYVLKATVVDGTVTTEWVLES